MKNLYKTISIIFYCFFHSISATSSSILLGSASYTGQAQCHCNEKQNINQYNLTITNAICTKEIEQSFKTSLQQIIPDANIQTKQEKNSLSIEIIYNPKKIALKVEERQTIDGKKKFTICVYDKQKIKQLKKMTKKPILQYTYNQNFLSAIA